MSFRYNHRIIALDNYAQVFGEECTPDVLDEIRSAILDNTPIENYIDPCGDDSYLLGQIRMALREEVPEEYLDPRLTGKTIYNIRQGFANGRDMHALMWYYPQKALRVDKSVIETLSSFCLVGADISRVDFTLVPKGLVATFCKGLYKGYPMWLLTDDAPNLPEAKVKLLMRGMELGIDIHPFVRKGWDKNVMLLMFSYAKSVDLNTMLSYINQHFNTDQVKELLNFASAGIPINRLCVKDHSGAPVYNSYQMHELGESLKQGVDIQVMFNPRLSDYDMAKMREAELAKRSAS